MLFHYISKDYARFQMPLGMLFISLRNGSILGGQNPVESGRTDEPIASRMVERTHESSIARRRIFLSFAPRRETKIDHSESLSLLTAAAAAAAAGGGRREDRISGRDRGRKLARFVEDVVGNKFSKQKKKPKSGGTFRPCFEIGTLRN